MSELRLNGIIPPLTTPFDDQGNVDLSGLAANLDRYNETGLVGYVALGSNGEAVHLSTRERLQVVEAVKRASVSGRTVIAGVNELSTRAAIEFTRRSAEAGADAVLVVTPYYYKSSMTQEALFRYYTAVADGSPVPVLLYNVPQNTGIIIEPATIASLAEHQNIVGIKDSAGNVSAISDTLRLAPGSFAVLAGSGSILYPSLLLGATGAILAVACVAPDPCVELFDAAQAGELERARELHNRVAPLSHAVTAKFGVAGLKAAMDLARYVGGVPRAPLLRLSEPSLETLRALMRGSGLFPHVE